MTLNSSHNSSSISRRRFFLTSVAAGTLGATALGGPKMAVAQDLDVDAFLELSESIIGKEGLDQDIATAMLQALQTRGDGAEIAALLDGGTSPELENDIAAAWYSGVSPDPDAFDVLTYTDALMWDAMRFTKPMAYCGGGMGYWAEPPVS